MVDIDVQRLELKRGDVVVLSVNERVSQAVCDDLLASMKESFPDNDVVILTKDVSLSVVGAP